MPDEPCTRGRMGRHLQVAAALHLLPAYCCTEAQRTQNRAVWDGLSGCKACMLPWATRSSLAQSSAA